MSDEEARMATGEGRMPFGGGETWYRVVGKITPDAAQIPVVICHGGPGAAHDYVEAIAGIARAGRACVLYDQLGCGNSTHMPHAPAAFWTPELFLGELVALTEHLGIGDRYVVIGQSWGGMMAMQHAIARPAGLAGIVVADSPPSIAIWIEETGRLRRALPHDVQTVLTAHETAGTTDSPAYDEAVRVFYDRHLCRVPWPDCLQRSFDQLAEDPTVYHTMNGPSEFHCIGTLVDWDITDRLPRIAVPTLLISGRHDEATPTMVALCRDLIPDARWELFEESSHTPHIEEPAKFLRVVESFLADVDATA